MNDTINEGTLAPRWFEVRNDGEEDIPPRSPCEIVKTVKIGGRLIYTVQRVSQNGWRERVLINGPTSISIGEYGAACRGPVVAVAYDTSSSPPQIDEEWGPVDGSEFVAQDQAGAIVVHSDTSQGVVLLWRDASSGSDTLFVFGTTTAEMAPNLTADMIVSAGAPSYRKVADEAGLDEAHQTIELDNRLGLFVSEGSPVLAVRMQEAGSESYVWVAVANGCPGE